MGFQKVAQTTELADGKSKWVNAGGEDVALFNCGGKIYATANTCPHQGGPLGDGQLSGTVVTCPWHGWRLDVSTGISLVSPSISIQCYKTKIEGNDILVEV